MALLCACILFISILSDLSNTTSAAICSAQRTRTGKTPDGHMLYNLAYRSNISLNCPVLSAPQRDAGPCVDEEASGLRLGLRPRGDAQRSPAQGGHAQGGPAPGVQRRSTHGHPHHGETLRDTGGGHSTLDCIALQKYSYITYLF